jgi:acetyl-CoA carboxylase biotin carboxyl carrier protein
MRSAMRLSENRKIMGQIVRSESFTLKGRSVQFAAPLMTQIIAPITGIVWKILVSVGEQVTPNQPIILLESMKMEVPVCAPSAGIIISINVSPGDSVEDGDAIVTLTS